MVKLLLASIALATFTPIEPVIEFTSDSVYKCDDILEIDLRKSENFEETYLVDIELKEVSRLGYKIYDVPETPYIDGVKWDGEWLDSSWIISNVDFSKAHTLQIKTIYTDDYAGMIMSAKDGDWSLMLKNPETILKLIYYGLSVISILVSVILLMFGKKHKAKSSEEISNKVTLASEKLQASIELEVQKSIKSIVSPIIKSLVLSKSNNPEDIVAMLDLLESTDSKEEIKELSSNIKTEVAKQAEVKKAQIEQAKEDVRKIAESTFIDDIKL